MPGARLWLRLSKRTSRSPLSIFVRVRCSHSGLARNFVTDSGVKAVVQAVKTSTGSKVVSVVFGNNMVTESTKVLAATAILGVKITF